MNRKEFFKKLGLGALVVAVAPKVLAKDEYTEGLIPFIERTSKDKDYQLKWAKECYESYDTNLNFWKDLKIKNSSKLMITRNGFYCIGDRFCEDGIQWQITSMDDYYYYAYPL